MEAEKSARKMSCVENATHPGTRKLIMVTSHSPPLPQQHPQCQYLRKHANITQPIDVSSFVHDSSAIAIEFYTGHHFFPSISPLHLLLLLLLATQSGLVTRDDAAAALQQARRRKPAHWVAPAIKDTSKLLLQFQLVSRRKEGVDPLVHRKVNCQCEFVYERAIRANISKVGLGCTKHQARQPRCKDDNPQISCSKAFNQIYAFMNLSVITQKKKYVNNVHMYKTQPRLARILDQDKLP